MDEKSDNIELELGEDLFLIEGHGGDPIETENEAYFHTIMPSGCSYVTFAICGRVTYSTDSDLLGGIVHNSPELTYMLRFPDYPIFNRILNQYFMLHGQNPLGITSRETPNMYINIHRPYEYYTGSHVSTFGIHPFWRGYIKYKKSGIYRIPNNRNFLDIQHIYYPKISVDNIIKGIKNIKEGDILTDKDDIVVTSDMNEAHFNKIYSEICRGAAYVHPRERDIRISSLLRKMRYKQDLNPGILYNFVCRAVDIPQDAPSLSLTREVSLLQGHLGNKFSPLSSTLFTNMHSKQQGKIRKYSDAASYDGEFHRIESKTLIDALLPGSMKTEIEIANTVDPQCRISPLQLFIKIQDKKTNLRRAIILSYIHIQSVNKDHNKLTIELPNYQQYLTILSILEAPNNGHLFNNSVVISSYGVYYNDPHRIREFMSNSHLINIAIDHLYRDVGYDLTPKFVKFKGKFHMVMICHNSELWKCDGSLENKQCPTLYSDLQPSKIDASTYTGVPLATSFKIRYCSFTYNFCEDCVKKFEETPKENPKEKPEENVSVLQHLRNKNRNSYLRNLSKRQSVWNNTRIANELLLCSCNRDNVLLYCIDCPSNQQLMCRACSDERHVIVENQGHDTILIENLALDNPYQNSPIQSSCITRPNMISRTSKCTNCNINPITLHCLECIKSNMLCDVCDTEIHTGTKETHERMQIKEYRAAILKYGKCMICSLNNPVSVYCENCKEKMCKLCDRFEHRDKPAKIDKQPIGAFISQAPSAISLAPTYILLSKHKRIPIESVTRGGNRQTRRKRISKNKKTRRR